ncbi:unnamed protein product [Amaranthus hypochondriacus]
MGALAILLIILSIVIYYIAYSCFNHLGLIPNSNPIHRASTGLDPAILTQFPILSITDIPNFDYKKDLMECTVCLGSFEKDETLRLLPCEHIFHLLCIDRWLMNQTTCPICRADLCIMSDELTGPVESGSGLGFVVENDRVEIRREIEEGRLKIWRWNSTGHIVDIIQQAEGDDSTGEKPSPTATRNELGTTKLIRSRSCLIINVDIG